MTRGHCLCGACGLGFEGEIKFAIRCYCRDCQQVTGGGHAVQAGVDAAGLVLDGPRRVHRAKSSSGNDLEFVFCGDCGSPLVKTTSSAPNLAFVYAGALDDPAAIPDPRPVFEAGRQPWDRS